jgi:dTDP-4-amino-4,6-dideoxygalactose transaminase
MMNYFKEWNLPCPVAEKVWESFVTLPLHVHLKTEETGYISEKLISFERKYF